MKTFLLAVFGIFQITALYSQIELDGSNYNNQWGINGPPPSISPVLASALGDHPLNEMGYNNSIKIIGDINDDGIDDILVGAQWEHEDIDSNTPGGLFSRCGAFGGCNKGRVYLILGRTQTEWENLGANLKLDSIAFMIFKVSPTAEYLGARLGRGDLNGDGIMDVIFSSYAFFNNQVPIDSNGIFYQGKVFVIAGRTQSEWDTFMYHNWSKSLILNPQKKLKIINVDQAGNDGDLNSQIFTNPDIAKFVTFIGSHKSFNKYDDMLGSALACQKINNDNIDDLIIGAMGAFAKHYPSYIFKIGNRAYTASAQNPGKGRIYVVKGGTNFFLQGINRYIQNACLLYMNGDSVDCQYRTDVLKTCYNEADSLYDSLYNNNKYNTFNEMIGFAIEPVNCFENSSSKGFIVGTQNIEGNYGYIHQRSVYYINANDLDTNNKNNGSIKNKSRYIINNPISYPNDYYSLIDFGWNRKTWNGVASNPPDSTFGISKSFFGSVLSTADFNGDGNTDIIIGDPAYCSVGFFHSGRIDIILGGTSNLPGYPNKIIQTNHILLSYKQDTITHLWNNPELTSTDQNSIVTYVGYPSGSWFGVSIANIGKMDNDIYDDIIVGSAQLKGTRSPNEYTRRDASIIYGHPVYSPTIDTNNFSKRQFTFIQRAEQYYLLKPYTYRPFSNKPFYYLFNQDIGPWEYTHFLGEETARFPQLFDLPDLTSAASVVAGGGDINFDGKPDFLICDELFSNLKDKEFEYIRSNSIYSGNIKNVNIGKIYFINGDFNHAAYQRKKYDWIKQQYHDHQYTFQNYSYPNNTDFSIMKSSMNSLSDLWIRDQLKPDYEDRGYEPNRDMSELWLSPDIWAVNNLVDSASMLYKMFPVRDKEPIWNCNLGLYHQQPEYGFVINKIKKGTIVTFDTSQKPVYIFVRIRNRGFETNDLFNDKPNEVHLYWSMEGSQGWSNSWINNFKVIGLDTFCLGNEITPIIDPLKKTNMDPLQTSYINPKPRVAPGEYKIIAFKWFPPDPAKYPEDWKIWSGKNIHVCFLARITGDTSSPYGMTYQETTDLYRNVGYNNNIAWKNMVLVNNDNPIKYKLGITEYYNWPPKDNVYLLNGFENGSISIFKIKVKGRNYNDISQFGKAYLNIPKSLYDSCISQNATFNNLELKVLSNDSVNYEVTSDSSWISGIPLQPDAILPVRFYFMPNNGLLFDKPEIIKYDLLQEEQGREYPLGGATFVMILDTFKEPQVNIIDINTTGVTSITQTQAICGGEISSDGGSSITERGVCWSSIEIPTISDDRTINGTGNGNYTSTMTNLIENTIYYVRAYATNSSITNYGNTIMFSTKPNYSYFEVNTDSVTAITSNTATCGGIIITDGNSSITEKGVCWSTSINPTVTDNKTTDGFGDGNYISAITGLSSNTTYYVRAFATSNSGTIYGDNKAFITIPSEP
jgi:hypothetical protein